MSGVSDGASDLRAELGRHCGQLILDFRHAAGYVAGSGPAMTAGPGARGGIAAPQWVDQAVHRLKAEDGGAAKLLAEMERQPDNGSVLTGAERTELTRAAGYFANNLDRMDQAAAVREKLSIGSGITEAACKKPSSRQGCAAEACAGIWAACSRRSACARCGAAPTAGTSSGNALTATASEKKPVRQLSHQTAGTAFPQIPNITNQSHPSGRGAPCHGPSRHPGHHHR
ncbi:MAG: ISKra4 family transposase [Verrucomicrobiales bacterium]|nr:ISKra4 family transposase [Verrucomicrobiales bacterium]